MVKDVRSRGFEWIWIHVWTGPKDIIEVCRAKGYDPIGVLSTFFELCGK